MRLIGTDKLTSPYSENPAFRIKPRPLPQPGRLMGLLHSIAGIPGAELNAPKSDGLEADGDTAFSQKIFDEWSGTPAVAVTTRLRLNR